MTDQHSNIVTPIYLLNLCKFRQMTKKCYIQEKVLSEPWSDENGLARLNVEAFF